MKNLSTWRGILAGIAMAVLVSGCGGGGGGNPPPPKTFTITTTVGLNGTITPPGPISVNQGASQAITATPSLGYLSLFSIDGGLPVSMPSYTFSNVQADHAVGVTFSLVPIGGGGPPPPNPPPQLHNISGFAQGGVQGQAKVTVSGMSTSTTTAPDGSYSLAGFPNGGYTLSLADPSNPTVVVATASVTVNGVDITNANFTTPVPMQTTGTILFPAFMAMDKKVLATGVESLVWGATSLYPETIIPARVGGTVAFNGSNINCIRSVSLSTLTATGCLAPVGGLSAFDITETADVVVASDLFQQLGSSLVQQNIILYTMSSSGSASLRVTNGTDVDTFPVICSKGGATTQFAVCFVRNGVQILRQVVDPANNLLVGSPTSVASNPLGYGLAGYFASLSARRIMSMNADYAKIAFVKNVNSVYHIFIKPIVGGAEVDIGPGSDPYWAHDGSDRILYSIDKSSLMMQNVSLFTIKADGTGKMQVPLPTNLTGSLGQVVFGPAGY